MKYNQEAHKSNVISNLIDLLDSVNLDSTDLSVITYSVLRKAINSTYPPITPTQDNKQMVKLITRKRRELLNSGRYYLYAYNTIMKRELNGL